MLKKQLFLVLFVYLHWAVGQDKQTATYIKTLDTLVAHLDEQEHWTKVDSFQIENFSSKMAILKVYYEDQTLRKMVLKGRGSSFELEKRFYLENDSLRYAREQHIQYVKPMDGAYDTQQDEVELNEIKSYFKQDKLLYQLDNTIHGDPSLSEAYLKATGASILDELRVLRALLDNTD
ncbi:hypothetical protein [Spongiimicrobium sp. 2-473A-2-J]|uniref:hypothetical protein n=1 Tax=Eudoraea algarum TaxID=3417568 RepID=UPI003D368AC7